MADVKLQGVAKAYGATTILPGVALDIHDGEFMVLEIEGVHDCTQTLSAAVELPVTLTGLCSPHFQPRTSG